MKPGFLSEIFVSFQGEGAHVGRRHLFVRLAGCNLRCSYCDTPDSLERSAEYSVFRSTAQPVHRRNPESAAALAEVVTTLAEEEAPIDAIALTGGEPLTQSDFLAAFLEVGRFSSPVLLETNGVLPRRLRDVLSLIDIVSMDIKLPSNTGEGPFWREHLAFLELARTKELYVKVLVDQSTTEDDVEQAAAVLASSTSEVPTFLQPITDKNGRSRIDFGHLTRLYLLMRRHGVTARVLPQTHKLLGIR